MSFALPLSVAPWPQLYGMILSSLYGTGGRKLHPYILFFCAMGQLVADVCARRARSEPWQCSPERFYIQYPSAIDDLVSHVVKCLCARAHRLLPIL